MITPYDWYEGLTQRSQYIENRLRTGSPVVGLSITEGVMLYTYRRQVRKVYEVYDRLMFAALGQQADVESLRVTAVEFAHQEGYLRSERDVTIQRVVGFALSAPLRRAYGDITVAPFVVNALFAEINEKPEDDLFYTLRYDGDFDSRRGFAVVAGSPDAERRGLETLEREYKPDLSLEEAQSLADRAWKVAADVEGTGEPLPELVSGAQVEVGFLTRLGRRERRFQRLVG